MPFICEDNPQNTKDEDVFAMIEQNGFSIIELKCVSDSEALFTSYKLAVPRSEFSKLFKAVLHQTHSQTVLARPKITFKHVGNA